MAVSGARLSHGGLRRRLSSGGSVRRPKATITAAPSEPDFKLRTSRLSRGMSRSEPRTIAGVLSSDLPIVASPAELTPSFEAASQAAALPIWLRRTCLRSAVESASSSSSRCSARFRSGLPAPSRSLALLDRATDCRSPRGARVANPAYRASFHCESIAASNAGTKPLNRNPIWATESADATDEDNACMT